MGLSWAVPITPSPCASAASALAREGLTSPCVPHRVQPLPQQLSWVQMGHGACRCGQWLEHQLQL